MAATVAYDTSLEADGRRLGEDLDDLEREAGIYDQAQEARRGRLIPDFNETTDEYFEAEHDHVRRALRRVYFSVPDPEKRRRLIAAVRRLEAISDRMTDRDVVDAERHLARAKAEADRLPWGLAAAVGGGGVAIGYAAAGLPGCIGGAVVGFVMAQGTVDNARRNSRRAVEQAQADLDSWLRTRAEIARRPAYFTASEEASSEPDREIL